MVTGNCPHCGKPIRPGSRYCGNCGNAIKTPAVRLPTLAGDATEIVSEDSTEDALKESWLPCPNCSRPVRPGAKYCHHCGEVIAAQTPVVASPLPADAQVETIAPIHSWAEPTAEKIDSNDRQPAKRKWKGRVAVPLLVSGILLACVAAIVGAYLFLLDPFNWFAAAPLVMATDTQSIISPVVQTSLPSQTAPSIPAATTLAPTTPLVSTSTPTVELTDTAIPTDTPSQPVVILVDDFDNRLNEQWVIWLAPTSPSRPKISTGPGENFLELMAIGDPGEAGITSRKQIPYTTGLDIQFIGQLKPGLTNQVMILDWDPSNVKRGPLSITPGVIHLEVYTDELIFGGQPDTADKCQLANDGYQQHSYRVVIEKNLGLALYIDGSQEPVCVLGPAYSDSQPGFVTFTGAGWITKVQVTTTPLN